MSSPFQTIPIHSQDQSYQNLLESNAVPEGYLGIELEQLPLINYSDDTYNAWIPSKATADILEKLSSCSPGASIIDTIQLTMPGIATKEDFSDPVKNLVKTFQGEDAASQLNTLTSSSVTQDDRGLRQLIAHGCFHAAVNLTTQLLTVYGQGEGKAGQLSKHSAHSIQLWFTRIVLLVKLRRFSLAEVECEAFKDLDTPDLYFKYYPELYGGKKGSMVPFSFRILIAVLPQYLGKHMIVLDSLSKILSTCTKIINNLEKSLTEDGNETLSRGSKDEALQVWRNRKIRVLYALANCSVTVKEFRLATSLLNTLLQEDPQSVAKLYSAIGRLYLYLGDISSAQEAFNRYLEYSANDFQHNQVQGLLHSALVSCAQNDFFDATQILQQAYKIAPANVLVINNLAVAMMFVGEIRNAIDMVEKALSTYPQELLYETLVLNLATMYELESSEAHKKKLNLLTLVSKHKGDGFNVAALKLQVS